MGEQAYCRAGSRVRFQAISAWVIDQALVDIWAVGEILPRRGRLPALAQLESRRMA